MAIVIVALALLAAIWWLWWQLPKRQVRGLDIQIHDPKARADTEDNFRKTVGQALGGAAVRAPVGRTNGACCRRAESVTGVAHFLQTRGRRFGDSGISCLPPPAQRVVARVVM